ncbi:MAG: hypothetical protein KDD47_17945 [Acidobacteria bacterium]|nr:hypothetical protein [Acidobacteriota bacterium]
MNQLLERILALQEANDALADAEQRLSGIPDWMKELHEEHASRKAEIDNLEAVIEATLLERRAAEGEIAEIQSKMKRYQEQINQVTTQREYGALLHEIDTAKARITELEEAGISSMERREAAQGELEGLRSDFQDLDQRYSAELAKWEAEKPSVAQQVAELKRQVEELRGSIKRPYLVLYDRIAERNAGSALAPIRLLETNRKGPRVWHCGGCNYNVRPQVVVQVRSGGSLSQCDSCKRVLYIPDSEEQED